MYVACSSNKLRIGDVYNKALTSKKCSTVNCASCENNIKFIADTGASDHFTHNKSDFVTFAKMDGEIKTADEESILEIKGYGTVFIKHKILPRWKSLLNFNLYTMLLAWLTDLLVSEVYCRKAIIYIG